MKFDLYKNKKSIAVDYLKSKLFDIIEDSLFILVISSDNDYKMPFINDATYKMFEILPDNVFTNTILSAYGRIDKEDKNIVKESLFASIAKRKKWDSVFKVHLPLKGERRFKVSTKREINSEGSFILYGKISDVSDSIVHKSKFSISEEPLKFDIETSTSGIWDWDVKRNIIFYSAQTIKILELKSTAIFDSPEGWNKILHPEDIEKYHMALCDHFESKTPYYQNFHRVLTSKGNYKWILSRGKVTERDETGKPLRIIGTHTDVSAQNGKELPLIQKIECYSEKNSRLLNFSYIVSHNLNSHAGNFKLLLDMIDLGGSFGEKYKTMNYLRTVSNDLNKTIEDLKQMVDVHGNKGIPVESLNVQTYLNRVLNIVNSYNYRNNAIIKNNIPAEATINFNPAYLESVLQNLYTNAIKYANPKKDLVVEFNFFLENEKKVLTVKDNGLGIDMIKYGHLLFGMYKTFHKHEQANGIGLYITKNQIESMKGTITAESQIGKGTIFKIIFND